MRICAGVQLLAIKFSYRENLPDGVYSGGRAFPPKLPQPRPICPVHFIWEYIRTVTRPGETLLPALSKSNSNPALKRVCARTKIPDASGFPPHCFRGEATQALKNGGSAANVLAGSGAWNSRVVLGYVDLTQDESAEHSAALLNPPLSSESEDDLLPIRAAIRKRTPRLHQLSGSLPNAVESDPEQDDDITAEYMSEVESPTSLGYYPYVHWV